MRTVYIVPVSVSSRLFWSAICGGMSYDAMQTPSTVLHVLSVGLAVLCVLAFIAAMRLLALKIRLVFWHG